MRDRKRRCCRTNRPALTTLDAAAIRESLACGRSGCDCDRARSNTHCPAHDSTARDQTPSLSVTEEGGKLLVKCFNGCTQDAVIAALKAKGLWPGPAGSRRSGTARQRPKTARKAPATPGGGGQAGTDPPVKGVTVLQLAEAKGLSADFLRELGVADFNYQGQKAVKMAYRGVTGAVTGTRYRVSVEGDRFRWKSGDKVQLYGLWRLSEAVRVGWALLVEGESDCWAGWFSGIPAFGAPGKSTWRTEWAAHFTGLTVYLWQEPDAEGFTRRVAQDIPDLRIIVAPDGIKDIADAHKLGTDLVPFLEKLKATAFPAKQLLDADKQVRLEGLRETAAPVLASADPIALVQAAIPALGYGGDTTPVQITYLALTSRLLAHRRGSMPVHILLLAASSVGKSYALQTALALHPAEAYHVIDAGSPRVLIYDTADLRHRAVIFGEADSLPAGEDNPAASAVRNLLADGRLHYKVTVRDPETGGPTS